MALSMGQIIKKLRKERNLTQEKLANQLNVTFQTISKWENETGMPDISQVVPMAKVFGVTTDCLFDYTTQPKLELKLFRVEKYDDVNEICRMLRENKTVVVNCEKIDENIMHLIENKIIIDITDVSITHKTKTTFVLTRPPVAIL